MSKKGDPAVKAGEAISKPESKPAVKSAAKSKKVSPEASKEVVEEKKLSSAPTEHKEFNIDSPGIDPVEAFNEDVEALDMRSIPEGGPTQGEIDDALRDMELGDGDKDIVVKEGSYDDIAKSFAKKTLEEVSEGVEKRESPKNVIKEGKSPWRLVSMIDLPYEAKSEFTHAMGITTRGILVKYTRVNGNNVSVSMHYIEGARLSNEADNDGLFQIL